VPDPFSRNTQRSVSKWSPDGFGRCEFVRICDYQDESIDGHGNLNQKRLVYFALDKAEIRGAIKHGARNLQRIANMQLHRYARVGRMEPIEKRRQPITGNGLAGPQAQPPAQ
jgi:hypothetical protein